MPLVIKRRHNSKLIVPPAGTDAVKASSTFDLLLIRTLGKAFYWQALIDSGEVANASELARNLKLAVGWVCEVLRMTRLAPDMIRVILDGRQPRYRKLPRRLARCAAGRSCPDRPTGSLASSRPRAGAMSASTCRGGGLVAERVAERVSELPVIAMDDERGLRVSR